MPLAERRARYLAMMAVLQKNDITLWRSNFLHALHREAVQAPGVALFPEAFTASSGRPQASA
jgi:trehalose-6-phosphate synthase